MRPQATLQCKEILDLLAIPSDWKVTRVAFDWNGEPLVLIEEGKPPQASDRHDISAVAKWMNSPPCAHYVITWSDDQQNVLRFENAVVGTMTAHVQRFKDGWLLGETRSGRAIIYDAAGKPTGSEFDLGDASEDIQVSENGAIWVSYFDEGVFGGGVGNAGLVGFNSVGQVIFRYSDFAEHHKLPPVDDLYALNVVDESDVWISYYSDFPLVRIRNWKEAEVWNDFGPTKCISVSGPMVVSARAYEKGRLNRSILTNAVWNHEELIPVDFQGATISPPFRAWARRDRMCLLTNTKIYSCVISDITELSS